MKQHNIVKLTSPRVWRTYRGGSMIEAIHGNPNAEDTQLPEEWILSTVNARNVGREHIPDEGLCYLAGTDLSLRDFIAQAPDALLGAAHYEKFGSSTGVLVKIIDAAERLTMQAHPNKETAAALFHSPFGKTECWHILDTRMIGGQKPCIYLGFREGVTREYWKHLFEIQDIPAMLSCLHKFDVQPGETYLVQAGVPHAIGAGCLLIEIQEPTDFTVRTERITPNGLQVADFLCHQGLGFEKMFDCFEYKGVSLAQALDYWRIEPSLTEVAAGCRRWELIGNAHTYCFSLERYEISTKMRLSAEGVMSGLYIYAGTGTLSSGTESWNCKPGDQFFYPAGGARLQITADPDAPITLFRCFGPTA